MPKEDSDLQPASNESGIVMDPFTELPYVAYQEYLKRRVIIFNGTVKEDAVERVILPLIDLSSQSTSKPIQLWISSDGGSMEMGQAVVDVITSLRTPIVTLCLGKAMSSAFDIFMAGDHRVMYANSILMTHSGTHSLGERTLASTAVEAELNSAWFKRWAAFYASRTKIGQEEWLGLLKTGLNRYFFAEEALAKGIVHQVVLPKKKLSSSKHLKW